MLPRMARKPRIALVGAGSLGSALAGSLRDAGYSISEVVSRPGQRSRQRAAKLARKAGAQAATLGSATLSAEIVWLCVPDREIAQCARSLAVKNGWTGKVVFHSSGALTSDELNTLRRKGAKVASLHPLMTFVPGVRPSLAGVPFAVEGDGVAAKVARRILADLGGQTFTISKRRKPAYHAWGSFASPLLLATLVTAERVAEVAGITRSAARRRMLPIIFQTLTNYAQRGPAGAFSGPIIRGDVATVEKHLQVLKPLPEARAVYVALARSALRMLPVKNRRAIRKALEKATAR
jgi:predicted short-subunit dehydrogenase-like oxidoreductase (DUF2520 family)